MYGYDCIISLYDLMDELSGTVSGNQPDLDDVDVFSHFLEPFNNWFEKADTIFTKLDYLGLDEDQIQNYKYRNQRTDHRVSEAIENVKRYLEEMK